MQFLLPGPSALHVSCVFTYLWRHPRIYDVIHTAAFAYDAIFPPAPCLTPPVPGQAAALYEGGGGRGSSQISRGRVSHSFPYSHSHTYI